MCIRDRYKALEKGVEWPNQTAESYKDELSKRAEKLYGPKLEEPYKRRFNKLIRACSMVFWIAGCNAPRVSGFTADIKTKPGYVGKVQQHFRLSEFDQRRLEYHEDIEVAEGKAEWAPPGTSTEFGSPSFVVDQAGKGVLGLSLIHI